MEIGGKTFTLYYFGKAHTDNDLAIVIKEEKVLILADLLFMGMMPYIIYDHGANVANWIEVLEFFKDNSQLYTKVVPGHGGVVTDEKGIVEAQRYLRYVWKSALKAHKEGKTLEQAKKEITLDIFKHLNGFERMLPRSRSLDAIGRQRMRLINPKLSSRYVRGRVSAPLHIRTFEQTTKTAQ